ncbi:MAG: hypothetical protein ACLQVD_18315 [Capsulimonadaceae bacterium]
MFRKSLMALSVAFILFPCGTACKADDSLSAGSWTVRLGVFDPSDSLVNAAVGGSWFHYGVDYTLASKSPTKTFVYLDGDSKGVSGTDENGNPTSFAVATVGFGIGVKQVLSQDSTQSVQPYVGAGLGIYSNAGVSLGTDQYGNVDEGTSTSDNIGFKILGGILFQSHFKLEIAYADAGDLGGVSMAGTSFDLGYAF